VTGGLAGEGVPGDEDVAEELEWLDVLAGVEDEPGSLGEAKDMTKAAVTAAMMAKIPAMNALMYAILAGDDDFFPGLLGWP
jgi:hypothetical protein